jgi:nitroreductase
MDIEKAIAGRRAVRDYTNHFVDKKAIRDLIAAAVLAPSAVNQQSWTFTVVRDQPTLDRISHDAKAFMLETATPGPHSEHFRLMLSDPAFHIFYHAPALIVISAAAPGPWVVEDCALAAENMMLAAYACGLGTCWIGFAQAFLNTSDGKNMLGIPAAALPVAPIIVGHPKAQVPPVSRKEPDIRWIG